MIEQKAPLLILILVLWTGSFAVGAKEVQPEESLQILAPYLDEAINKLPSSEKPCPNSVEFRGEKYGIKVGRVKLDSQTGIRDVHYVKFDERLKKFSSADEAAKFFADFVHAKIKTRFVEYCANIVQNPRDPNQFSISVIYQGDQQSCVVGRDEKNVRACVHIHPGDDDELSLPAQVPSASDFAKAAFDGKTEYMVGPGGQIFKYTKDDVECRGQLMIRFNYQQIRGPRVNTRGEMPDIQTFHPMNKEEKENKSYYCKGSP